jgi:hypothetical protein
MVDAVMIEEPLVELFGLAMESGEPKTIKNLFFARRRKVTP